MGDRRCCCGPCAVFSDDFNRGSSSMEIADGYHEHITEDVTLRSGVAFSSIDDTLHAHTAEAVLLTTSVLLDIEDCYHAHTSDALLLTTKVILDIEDCYHAHLADDVDLESPECAVFTDGF